VPDGHGAGVVVQVVEHQPAVAIQHRRQPMVFPRGVKNSRARQIIHIQSSGTQKKPSKILLSINPVFHHTQLHAGLKTHRVIRKKMGEQVDVT